MPVAAAWPRPPCLRCFPGVLHAPVRLVPPLPAGRRPCRIAARVGAVPIHDADARVRAAVLTVMKQHEIAGMAVAVTRQGEQHLQFRPGLLGDARAGHQRHVVRSGLDQQDLFGHAGRLCAGAGSAVAGGSGRAPRVRAGGQRFWQGLAAGPGHAHGGRLSAAGAGHGARSRPAHGLSAGLAAQLRGRHAPHLRQSQHRHAGRGHRQCHGPGLCAADAGHAVARWACPAPICRCRPTRWRATRRATTSATSRCA